MQKYSDFDTVVFDFGNVLIGWDPVPIWREMLPVNQIEEFKNAVEFDFLNSLLDEGVPSKEVFARVSPEHKYYRDVLDHYWQNFDRSLTGAIPGSEQLVEILAANGYRLLGLTNWSTETFHFSADQTDALAKLDGVIVSGDVQLAKPDPRIFELLVERFGLDPARTVFIDDSAANVETARTLGMTAFVFVDTATLTDDLQRVGVSVY